MSISTLAWSGCARLRGQRPLEAVPYDMLIVSTGAAVQLLRS